MEYNINVNDIELAFIENSLMFYYAKEVDRINSVQRNFNQKPSEDTVKRLDKIWKLTEKIRQYNPELF
jgi:hypothetical protein